MSDLLEGLDLSGISDLTLSELIEELLDAFEYTYIVRSLGAHNLIGALIKVLQTERDDRAWKGALNEK